MQIHNTKLRKIAIGYDADSAGDPVADPNPECWAPVPDMADAVVAPVVVDTLGASVMA